METFEIYITGNEKIHSVCEKLNVKTIAIDLLRPDFSVLRTEHMTSIVQKHDDIYMCHDHVQELVEKLRQAKVDVHRIKIECPFIQRYVPAALYIESHFTTKDAKYPISRNQNKTDILATVRILGSPDGYSREYAEFAEIWRKHTVELCLHDTNVRQDFDWLKLWEN